MNFDGGSVLSLSTYVGESKAYTSCLSRLNDSSS